MFKVYDRGDPVLSQAEVKEWKEKAIWEYEDPDTIKIKIFKGSTIKVSDENMQKQGTHKGFYYHVWQTVIADDLGEYQVEITTTFGNYSEKTKGIVILR